MPPEVARAFEALPGDIRPALDTAARADLRRRRGGGRRAGRGGAALGPAGLPRAERLDDPARAGEVGRGGAVRQLPHLADRGLPRHRPRGQPVRGHPRGAVRPGQRRSTRRRWPS